MLARDVRLEAWQRAKATLGNLPGQLLAAAWAALFAWAGSVAGPEADTLPEDAAHVRATLTEDGDASEHAVLLAAWREGG